MPEFLTTGQAAELLGVSKPTVVRAVRRGLLRPAMVTPGQHRRFRLDDVMAFRTSALAYPADVEVVGRDRTGEQARASLSVERLL